MNLNADQSDSALAEWPDEKPWIKRTKRLTFLILKVIVCVSIAVFALWAMGALWFHPWLPRLAGAILAIIFALATIALFVKIQKRRIALSFLSAMIVLVYLSWFWIRPQQERDWEPVQQKMPHVSVRGDNVAIHNVRYCRYRSLEDYEVDFETRRFKLTDIESVWYVIQKFTSLDSMAHTFLCFGINNGDQQEYFAVSVEIRRQKGEKFSALLGTFKQYELMYVVGDERDIVGVRTNIRKNDRVYMYRVNATPEASRQLFLRIAKRINQLRDEPEFYHTLFNNCTNNIVVHANSVTPRSVNPYAVRIVLPGFSGKSAFRAGLIGNEGETFEELQARSRIDQVARMHELDENFSSNIRKNID